MTTSKRHFKPQPKSVLARFWWMAAAFFGLHYKRIVELAAKSRLPAMYGNARYVEAGGLITYAQDSASPVPARRRVRG